MFLNDAQSVILKCSNSPIYDEAVLALEKEKQRFARDAATIHDTHLQNIIFKKSENFLQDHDDYTHQIGRLITHFENAESFPHLPSLCYAALSHFRIDFESSEAKALMTCAVLGEILHKHDFHNNNHFRKVFLATLRQIDHNNQMFAGSDKEINDTTKIQMLCAACIHDLSHDGKGNMKGGVHTPYKMEKTAFKNAIPFVRAAGVGNSFLNDLETIILCTDVSSSEKYAAPNKILKRAHRFHVQGEREGGVAGLPKELEGLSENPALCRAAILFHEADLIPSVGWGYDRFLKETVSVAKEIDLVATPSFALSFLQNILGHFETTAGSYYNNSIHSLAYKMQGLEKRGVTDLSSHKARDAERAFIPV